MHTIDKWSSWLYYGRNGRLTQWESASLTSKKSLVQIQYCPEGVWIGEFLLTSMPLMFLEEFIMKLYQLNTTVQHYQWGSTDLLPNFLGVTPDGNPWAELWMGTHKGGPSLVVLEDGCEVPLSQLLTELGFSGDLPYLFKVLAIESPLSLQVHPPKSWAERRYQEEDSAGVPLNAPHRLYKDSNHKPEILYALTPFTAMCGFRSEEEIREFLAPLFDGSLHSAIQDIPRGDQFFKAFFSSLMHLHAQDIDSLIQWVRSNTKQKDALLVIEKLVATYPGDIGAVAPLFLQLIHLNPGEALFQDAREIHAYVSGLGVELMANSDNVIRAGLTPKHVDIPELMEVVDFSYRKKEVVGEQKGHSKSLFPVSGVDDFLLGTIEVAGSLSLPEVESPEIWLIQGDITISCEGTTLKASQGNSLILAGGDKAKSFFLEGSGTIYTASIPRNS